MYFQIVYVILWCAFWDDAALQWPGDVSHHPLYKYDIQVKITWWMYWFPKGESQGKTAVLLAHFADLHVDFVNKFWTQLTIKWPWREHKVARRLHITITFYSCLVVFGVFAFLLASAQVMYTSHRLRFIYLFRSYICVFTLCCVRVGFVKYGSLASKCVFFCEVDTKWNFPTSRKNIFTSASLCA